MRVIRAILLSSTLIVSPTVAKADPGSFIAAATFLASSVGTAVGGTVGALITIGAAVAGAAATLLFAEADAQTQQQLRSLGRDPHPPFAVAIGEVPIEGDLVFHYERDGNYYQTIKLNDVPSESIDKIMLWDKELTFYSDANNDIYDMTLGANTNVSPWDQEVRVWIGMGDQTQFPTQFQQDLPDIIPAGASWNGHTVVHILSEWGSSKTALSRWKRGFPEWTFHGKWAKLYDLRKDSTSGVPGASGSHRWNDRSTWEYTRNGALATLFFCMWEKGLAISDTKLLGDMFAEAADECEVTDAVSPVQTLYTTPWTGVTIPAHSPGTDHGHGGWTRSRGTASAGPTQHSSLWGVRDVLRVFSTDTGGSVSSSETGIVGAYFDLQAQGFPVGSNHNLVFDTNVAGTVSQAKWRVRVYTADGGGSASTADQTLTHMPPDAANITLLRDSGFQSLNDPVPLSPGFNLNYTTKKYLSVVIEGGEPNQSDTEFRTLTMTLQANVSPEIRFGADGVVQVRSREFNILRPLLATFAGTLDTTNGYVGLRAGVWSTPTHNLAEPVEGKFEYDGRSYSGYDNFTGSYFAEHRDFEETETDTPYVLRSGDRRRTIGLSLVKDPQQAHRLVKITAERDRHNRKIRGLFPPSEWETRIGERVTVDWDFYPRANGNYRVLSRRPAPEETENGAALNVYLTLVEDEEPIYSWTAGDYSGSPTYEGGDTPTPVMAAPTTVLIEQNNDRVQNDGTVRPRIKVTIQQPLSVSQASEQIVIQVSENGGGFIDSGSLSPSLTGDAVIYIDPVTVGSTYSVQARNESSYRGVSGHTASTPASLTVVAPPSSLSAPTSTGQTHDAAHTWDIVARSPNQPGVAGMRIYVADTNDEGSASLLDTAYLAGNATYTFQDPGGFAGTTRYWWIRTIDSNGGESPSLALSGTAPGGATARDFSTDFSTDFG